MRDLSLAVQNTLTINDPISGSEIELYYRLPRTSERVAYQSAMFKKKGRKLKIDAFTPRVDFGLKILEGFRDGDFGIEGKPISSDPNSPHYHKDWKNLIRETAADILNTFAYAVFEGTSVVGVSLEEEEPGEEEPGEEGAIPEGGEEKEVPLE